MHGENLIKEQPESTKLKSVQTERRQGEIKGKKKRKNRNQESQFVPPKGKKQPKNHDPQQDSSASRSNGDIAVGGRAGFHKTLNKNGYLQWKHGSPELVSEKRGPQITRVGDRGGKSA